METTTCIGVELVVCYELQSRPQTSCARALLARLCLFHKAPQTSMALGTRVSQNGTQVWVLAVRRVQEPQ